MVPKPSHSNQRKIEQLHHFNCSHCQKWWSIGDAPDAKEIWFCPWCGKQNKFTSTDK